MFVSESMYELGSKRSAIRELFEYGKKRAAIVGAENVYDFSLCGEDDILTLGAEKYRFVKTSAYYTADKIIYYYCVARKIIGEDENVFE